MGLIRPALFVLSAPSGSGKTTLVKRALARLTFLTLSLSTTTRLPRTGETEGVDYHFCTKEQFLHSVAQGEFLEWAEVHGNFYGTSKKRIQEAQAKGMSVLLDIDVQGAMQLQGLHGFEAYYLFICPPGLEELKKRLHSRGTETPQSLTKRMTNAERELTFQDRYDHVILNDDLEEATLRFMSLLISHSVDLGRLKEVSTEEVIFSLTGNRQDPVVERLLTDLAIPGLGKKNDPH
ncbi:MAG: guanylate kinase [Candidatus Lambdaproteobacteria bacterium RIFOXYD1_FULL_56_27]|uniref:Guanylate kinase n=1 Tax=Candidatus Lambdaproteobacteria bacterium RIFOXYD2_FULL_56_26 TaxID=1817773 RepID=A0A1F6GSP8_9PROT|nr:MAG: guanylate kinase [Candidatus Lambdaproteobacteria bacterium RIFOXYC1_FULL_56_13]OGH01173.1 MAG: guanylate kinase [Candidatus Lambdaproteobacteria bacterium RIFOXYD2_FULL_56_26]OGH06443.1 MAG: guanylate kinase [Candidatus Lambdaproteobacteria bacterium RIFOXYD1_FULL_56_27]